MIKDELDGAEWISDQAVVPVEKEDYSSALEAMLENGVQVYFVDDETMENLHQSKDGGLSILQTLQSENQRRNSNIILLPNPEDA